MNYYPERAWQVVAYPTAPILLSFILEEYLRKEIGKDPIVYWLIMLPLALIGVGYIVLLIAVEVRWITESLPRETEQKEGLKYPDLNTSYISTYMTDNSEINWDIERNWAIALIRLASQLRSWENVNLTEDYWKAENRWLKIGGKSIDELRDIKVRWSEELDALERTNPNAKRSSYRVRNPQTISRLASGQKI